MAADEANSNVNKVPKYQQLSVHITTHRLILVPTSEPSPSTAPFPSSSSSSSSTSAPALQTHLSHVRQTEFYTGFMRSSAKITLFLGPAPSSSSSAPSSNFSGATQNGQSSGQGQGQGWTCRVCGYVNSSASALSTASGVTGAKAKCGLCGVAYSQAQASVPSSRPTTPALTPNPTLTPAPIAPSTVNGNGANDEVACPACTFLNSPFLPNCEICSTPLPSHRARPQVSKSTSGAGGTGTDGAKVEDGKVDIVRLSFRQGGEKEAYKKLKSVLSVKAWETLTQRDRDTGRLHDSKSDTRDGLPPMRSGAGIDGILQSMNLTAKAQDDHMQTAFQDLEALMVRAGDMVRLAQSLNNKLNAQQQQQQQQQQSASGGVGGGMGLSGQQVAATEEEVSMIRTSLVQLGLAAPALTQDMVKDQKAYHDGLAKELGALLTGRNSQGAARSSTAEGLMIGPQGRGVIGLDEVWGLWMRARGVALLPPSTLVDILPYIPSHTKPTIESIELPSSLLVIHTPHYSTPALLSRTIDRLAPFSPDSVSTQLIESGAEASLTLIEFAAHESLALALAQEFLEMLEKLPGGLVRDDQAGQADGGVKWYRDIINSYPLSQIS